MKEWTDEEIFMEYGREIEIMNSSTLVTMLMRRVDEELKGRKKTLRNRRVMLEHLMRHELGIKDVVRHFF